jgi:hypothetical protein
MKQKVGSWKISRKIDKILVKTNRKREAGHQWLTPIILDTWEAAIERITVQGQSRQKVYKTSSQPVTGCNGV